MRRMSNIFLNPENKKQFVQLLVGAAILVTALYVGVIQPQRAVLAGLREQLELKRTQRNASKKMAFSLPKIEEALAAIRTDRRTNEVHMAFGDVYFWMVRLLERHEAAHNLHFNQIEPPQTGPSQVIPHVPYDQTEYSISGTGAYHDIGSFLAELENNHPTLRLHHLELEPSAVGPAAPEDEGRLRFRMEFSVLVQTNGLSQASSDSAPK